MSHCNFKFFHQEHFFNQFIPLLNIIIYLPFIYIVPNKVPPKKP